MRVNRWALVLPLLFATSAIALVDQPPLKAGYWSVRVQTWNTPGGEPAVSKRFVCRNPEFDQAMRVAADAMTKRMGCKIVQEGFAESAFTSETRCTQSGSETVTRVKSVMKGDTATHAETVTTYDPPVNGHAKATMISDQMWIGACPAGVVPGDSVSESGQVTHLWRR